MTLIKALIVSHLTLAAALQIYPVSFGFPGPYCQHMPKSPTQISSTKYPFTTSEDLMNDKSNQQPTNRRENNTIEFDEDRRTIALHFFSCLTTAYSLVKYENYECANLKPQQASLKKSSVRGLAYGKVNRIEGKENTDLGESDESLWDIPSYNEIMLKHRDERVPRWRADNEKKSTTSINSKELILSSKKQQITDSVECLNKSLSAVLQLKELANNYDWNEMRAVLNSPTLNENLEMACNILRVELDFSRKNAINLDENNPPNVIGFGWGSCAWRHCGALADTEEALAELKNSLGLFEPFECLFTIDIAERALRDMITVVPDVYKVTDIPSYVPYVPQVSLSFYFSISLSIHRFKGNIATFRQNCAIWVTYMKRLVLSFFSFLTYDPNIFVSTLH